MYSAGYGFANNAAPSFNNSAPQQQSGAQPAAQQMMYNQQQQFAGMTPQGGFNPGANPQMMGAGPGGMMPNPGMQHMAANGQNAPDLNAIVNFADFVDDAGMVYDQARVVASVAQTHLRRDSSSNEVLVANKLRIVAGFQQQFPGNPYGQVASSSVAPQNFAPNYMMGGGMQGFPMNQGGMPQQPQMMQRMQQQQAQQQQQQQQQQQAQQQHIQQQQQAANPAGMGQVSTPQRPQSAAQGTPNNALQQGQFPTPQPPSQSQTPTSQHTPQLPQQQQQPPQQPQHLQGQGQGQTQQQQQPSAALSTPQTPTFASNQGPSVNGGSTNAVPLSPGTEARDKERFSLLLDINHELLYESIQIQATQQEIKKENAAAGNPTDKKLTEEETQLQQDYLQCMRRLQGNLSYMAALADRKPEVKVPPCPTYLSAPPLHLSAKLRAPALGGSEGSESNIDPVADREERNSSIKDLYSRLQAAFPGFDPTKEPAYRVNSQAGQKPGNLMGSHASPTGQRTPQITNMGAPPMP
ncbi:hypothetical protein FGRMN_9219 [Fusarium graminum]|nr:hypothetical protein FGRMN_9219 [Fusarium graminum]